MRNWPKNKVFSVRRQNISLFAFFSKMLQGMSALPVILFFYEIFCSSNFFFTYIWEWPIFISAGSRLNMRWVRGGSMYISGSEYILWTYPTPSRTNWALYLSRAGQIRLRTILSFIKSYKILTLLFLADFRSQLSLF